MADEKKAVAPPLSAAPAATVPTESVAEIVAAAVADVRKRELAGDFCSAGSALAEGVPLPVLTVPGIGPIAFPLLSFQAEALKAVCSPAPFGRGADTVFDKAVRDCHQLSPSQFTLNDPKFDARYAFSAACGQCAAPPPVAFRDLSRWSDLSFCVPCAALCSRSVWSRACALIWAFAQTTRRVWCRLYKLLLYESGGHFAAHRDSEKAAGMFATLIVQLPCDYAGGALVLRHCGRTHTIDMVGNW
jgi:hypothetical protein